MRQSWDSQVTVMGKSPTLLQLQTIADMSVCVCSVKQWLTSSMVGHMTMACLSGKCRGKNTALINRPCVAGAVLQTPVSLISSVSDPFPPNFQSILNHKQLELGGWNFERMFTPQKNHMSYVMCHMSRVTGHIYFFIHLFFRTKWWSLSVEGLLSMRPTPSSFCTILRKGGLPPALKNVQNWPASYNNQTPLADTLYSDKP